MKFNLDPVRVHGAVMGRRVFLALALALALAAPSWAAPTQSCTAATTAVSSSINNHTMNLPTNHSVGDMFVAFLSVDSNPSITITGWTQIKVFTQPANVDRIAAFYRVTTGAEGSTKEVVLGATETLASRVICLSGFADPGTSPPEASTGVDGSSLNPDADAVTPSPGDGDYFVAAVYGIDVSVRTFSAYPAGYSGSQIASGSGAGDTRLGVAVAELSGTTFNPGTATLNSGTTWIAFTMAVPAGAAAAPARRRLILSELFDLSDLLDPNPLRWFLARDAYAEVGH